jgi:hypothetical protein
MVCADLSAAGADLSVVCAGLNLAGADLETFRIPYSARSTQSRIYPQIGTMKWDRPGDFSRELTRMNTNGDAKIKSIIRAPRFD